MDDRYERVSTFTRWPSLAQLASYFFSAFQIVVFYMLIQHNYVNKLLQIVFNTILAICLSIQVISTVLCSAADPVDPILLQFKNGDKTKIMTELDQCLYCDICNSYVLNTSRHCKACNRCVHMFDHHCIWINNCIGQPNYHSFFIMILSTFLAMLIYMCSVGLLWSQGNTLQIYIIVLIWSLFVVSAMFALLLGNLIILHIYLSCNGLTTYEFLMNRRHNTKTKTNRTVTEQHSLEMVRHDHNITEENLAREISNQQNNIVFQSADEAKTSEQASFNQNKKDTPVASKQTIIAVVPATQLSYNVDQTLPYFQKYRSLRYLIGQGVVIRSRTQNQHNNQQTIKYHSTKPKNLVSRDRSATMNNSITNNSASNKYLQRKRANTKTNDPSPD